jgi:hypothetical protein
LQVVSGYAVYFFERFRATKKEIHFRVSTPDSITGYLQGHGQEFKVMLGDRVASELNVDTISVTNAGNTQIEDLDFDLKINGGDRHIILAECVAEGALKQDVKITFAEGVPQTDPVFHIHLGFFNAKETFQIKTLVDGVAGAREVSCRLPATTIKFITPEDYYAQYRRRERITTICAVLLLLTVLGVLFSAIFSDQSDQMRRMAKRVPTDILTEELKARETR